MAYAESPAAGNRWGSRGLAEDYQGAVEMAFTTEIKNGAENVRYK